MLRAVQVLLAGCHLDQCQLLSCQVVTMDSAGIQNKKLQGCRRLGTGEEMSDGKQGKSVIKSSRLNI